MSLNIRDYPDAGIIYAIEDNIGEDGYASVQDVGLALGQRELRGLAVRLAWMRRYKMVEKHKHEPGRWRVATSAHRAANTETLQAVEASSRRKGPEFDLLRRTVQHYGYRRRNGR